MQVKRVVRFVAGLIDIIQCDIGEKFSRMKFLIRRIGVDRHAFRPDKEFAIAINLTTWQHFPITINVRIDPGEFIKAPHLGAKLRLMSDMPFTRQHSLIASRTKHFSGCHAAIIQATLIAVAKISVDHHAYPRLMRIQSGQQTGTRWAAARRIVKLTRPETARPQTI